MLSADVKRPKLDSKEEPLDELQTRKIKILKERLTQIPCLNAMVSLQDKNRVLYIKFKESYDDIHDFIATLNEKFYTLNQYDFIVNKLDLNEINIPEDSDELIENLFFQVSCHLYILNHQGNSGQEKQIFRFPLDVNDEKDFDIVIQNMCTIKVSKNELLIEDLPEEESTLLEGTEPEEKEKQSYDLYIAKDIVEIKSGVKVNLLEVENSRPSEIYYQYGYACLYKVKVE